MKPSETDYAWAAGFIEADGSFSLNVLERDFKKKLADGTVKTYRRKMVQPVIRVSQYNPLPIQRLHSLFGGTLSKNGNGHSDRQYFSLIISGKDRLTSALQSILPYLHHKRKQARRLLWACKRQHARGDGPYSEKEWTWFERTKEEIKALNAARLYENTSVDDVKTCCLR